MISTNSRADSDTRSRHYNMLHLTLYALIDSSVWFYTINLGWSTVFNGSQAIILKKKSLKIVLYMHASV